MNNRDNDVLFEKIGCPLYTAPELLTPRTQFQGKPADMWSLGVILYTMLMGQYPFNEKNGRNLFINIRSCIISLPSALSLSVRCLIRCLLRPNPEERLIVDDLFYHPWMKTKPRFFLNVDPKLDPSFDEQCVPDGVSEDDDDVEMG